MFTNLLISVVICGLIAIVFMSLMFVVAKLVNRYDVVDAAWGLVFIVIALTSYLFQPNDIFVFDTQTITTLLVIIWGSRLALHIGRRIRATEHEDKRYVELRKNWRGNVDINMFLRVYLLQAVLALVVMLPVITINLFADDSVNSWLYVGLLVWIVGFIFETMGDSQLRDFIADTKNKGKIMDQGLWRYSRHPNYFGELTQWWGIFIICLGVPLGLVGIIGPLLISYLILFVSGVPATEKHFEGRYGWAEYKKRTSVIIPLPR